MAFTDLFNTRFHCGWRRGGGGGRKRQFHAYFMVNNGAFECARAPCEFTTSLRQIHCINRAEFIRVESVDEIRDRERGVGWPKVISSAS